MPLLPRCWREELQRALPVPYVWGLRGDRDREAPDAGEKSRATISGEEAFSTSPKKASKNSIATTTKKRPLTRPRGRTLPLSRQRPRRVACRTPLPLVFRAGKRVGRARTEAQKNSRRRESFGLSGESSFDFFFHLALSLTLDLDLDLAQQQL